jgi:3-hydroxymyristoyl/3-hydroxydecanoyl-(acyl carrier protein) dehydratase
MQPPSYVETRAPEALLWRFDVPQESPFFEGHFPGHPLLPGVVTLGWMLAAAERFLGRPLQGGATLHNVKFQVVLLPGQTGVELTVVPQGDAGRLLTRVVSSAGVHASALIEPGAAVDT